VSAFGVPLIVRPLHAADAGVAEAMAPADNTSTAIVANLIFM
jgi:hypothetical protein